MKKHIACKHVVSGCDFEATADSEAELLEKVAEHAQHEHGVSEVSPELLARVRSAIRDEPAAK